MDNNKVLHTVTLDPDKCKGCVACMKRCPTEAIRVRDGKAHVNYDRCIGCGECVRLCPHHAKLASYDNFESIEKYKYKIALPAPSLYSQFNNLTDVNFVLEGLLQIGFDAVFEVGRAAELVSEATKVLLDKGEVEKPVISTACPAVTELILVRFHNLKKHLLPLFAPVDIAAKLARENAIAQGIAAEDIGVFFISPCPAKVYALKTGMGATEPLVEGVLSVGDVYFRLLPTMAKITTPRQLSKLGANGLQWASSGGEAMALYKDKYLAADGMENVMNILNALEVGMMQDIEFIELNACVSGCVGGVLNVENAFVAKARLNDLRRKLPERCNHLPDVGRPLDYYLWQEIPEKKNVFRLDEDRETAMGKLMMINKRLSRLPQIDCGVCGAPSCRAFAEDVANGIISRRSKCPKLNKPTKFRKKAQQ